VLPAPEKKNASTYFFGLTGVGIAAGLALYSTNDGRQQLGAAGGDEADPADLIEWRRKRIERVRERKQEERDGAVQAARAARKEDEERKEGAIARFNTGR